MGADFGGYRIFNRGDTGVAGFMANSDPSIPPHWQPYVGGGRCRRARRRRPRTSAASWSRSRWTSRPSAVRDHPGPAGRGLRDPQAAAPVVANREACETVGRPGGRRLAALPDRAGGSHSERPVQAAPGARPRPRRARRQAHPRLPRRRARGRHHRAAAGLGEAALPRLLLPAGRRADRAARAGRRHVHSPSRGEAADLHGQGGRQGGAAGALRYEDSPSTTSARRSGSSGTPWTPGSRRTRRCSCTRATPTRGSTSCRSSRHVRVEVDGVTVAESAKPTLLFETGLPTRYYLPKTHVRMDLLTPTDTETHCPYKGQAEYWSVDIGRRRARRPRLVLPDAAAREPADRRPRLLLQREGRPVRRRRQAGLTFTVV